MVGSQLSKPVQVWMASSLTVPLLNVGVVVGGLVLLVVIAAAIGMSMDTEAQHRAADAVAEERRLLREERHQLQQERYRVLNLIHQLAEERRMLAEEVAQLERCRACRRGSL
jgi:hypothetical protein